MMDKEGHDIIPISVELMLPRRFLSAGHQIVPVVRNNGCEECDASDAGIEVFTRWSRRVDRRRSILPLPTVQKSALRFHD